MKWAILKKVCLFVWGDRGMSLNSQTIEEKTVSVFPIYVLIQGEGHIIYIRSHCVCDFWGFTQDSEKPS